MESLPGIGAQRLVNCERSRCRDVRREIAEQHGAALDLLQLRHRVGFRNKWRPPGDGVENRGRERIHVAAEILGAAVELFRRDVVRGRPHVARFLVLFLHEDRQPEVHDFRRVLVGKKNVPRLDVAMDEAEGEARLQPLRDLDGDIQRAILGHFLRLRHQRFQAAVIHHFHRDIQKAAMLAEGEYLHDVRVVQARRDLRLALEAGLERRVRAVLPLHHLDCHGPVQFFVQRPEHHALPAFAEDAVDFKMCEDLLHAHPRSAARAIDQRERLLLRHINERAATGTGGDIGIGGSLHRTG